MVVFISTVIELLSTVVVKLSSVKVQALFFNLLRQQVVSQLIGLGFVVHSIHVLLRHSAGVRTDRLDLLVGLTFPPTCS